MPPQALIAVPLFLTFAASLHAAGQPGEELRRDAYGDPLPPGAVARLGTVRFRSSGWFGGLTFSRDGKTLITGHSNVINLWDVSSGKSLGKLTDDKHQVETLVLSSDGKFLATGGHYGIIVWDLETRRPMHRFKSGPVSSLAISSDRKTLVSGGAEHAPAMRVWDLETGKERRRLMWHQRGVRHLSIAPDNRTLLSASYYKVHFADLITGEEIRSMPDINTDVVLLTPDGKSLILGGRRYRRETKEWEGFVETYDAGTGKRLGALPEVDRFSIEGAALTPDGNTLVTSEYRGLIRVWDLAAQKEKNRWESRAILRQVSPDGKVVAVTSRGRQPQLLDLATGMPLHAFQGHTGGVGSVAFSLDGKTLASTCYDEDVIHIWDSANGKHLRILRGHKDDHHPVSIRGVVFLPDGKGVISGADDSSLRLWHPATGHEVRKFQLHGRQQVVSLEVSSDSKLLLCGSTGFGGPDHKSFISVFDVQTGKEVFRRETKSELGNQSTFAKDGLTVVQEGGALCDLKTGKVLTTLKAPDQLGTPCVFSPDSKLLATCSSTPKQDGNRYYRDDHKVRVYDTASGKETHVFSGDWWFRPLAFSRDGKLLALAGEKTIQIQELATSKQLWRSPEVGSGVQSLDFAPDGRRLAAGYDNATILIWDITKMPPK